MTPQTPAQPSVIDPQTVPEMALVETGIEEQEAVTRYVVVNINANLYGMATDSTVELMSCTMTQITRVPHSPHFIEGVINHRGSIIPVIDARALLGFAPRGQEARGLQERFDAMRLEHERWLDALADSVNDNTGFEKTSDPQRCELGRWLGSLKDPGAGLCHEVLSEPAVNTLIKRFDAPHNRFHAIAQEVRTLRDQGQTEQALRLIEQTREHELGAMIELFGQISEAIAKQFQSMLVITEHEGRKAAIAVDGVSFVTDCPDSAIEPLPDTADNTEFLSGLVHQTDGRYILVADLGSIYSHACVAG